jgi:MFS family permease
MGTGVGGSGGFIAILTIISQIAVLSLRPILLASFGGVFGIASIFGPLLGGTSVCVSGAPKIDLTFPGVFTDRLTWRWCFYVSSSTFKSQLP